MAPRSYVHGTRDGWERVAGAVTDRRLALGISQNEAVERSGGLISLSVWSILEGARQTSQQMEVRTLDGAAVALSWPSGAIQRILAGEDPSSFDDEPPPPANVTPLRPKDPQDPAENEEQVELAALVGKLPPDKRAAIEQLVRTMLES